MKVAIVGRLPRAGLQRDHSHGARLTELLELCA
jgi:hypothetical protein